MSERKRKRVVLTLEEKLAVIQDRNAGDSVETIAEKFNIGASTVSEICKKRFQIEEAVERNKNNGINSGRKTLRETSKPLLETDLFNWYQEQVEQGSNRLSTNDFMRKASELYMQHSQLTVYDEDEADWRPTKGWLNRFKERYGIKAEPRPREQNDAWRTALDSAEYLLEYINARDDFLLKDVITVRMIRDKIATEQEVQITDGH